jgi:signal peptidase II
MSGSLDPGPTLSWRVLRHRWLIVIGAAVLAADQGSKAWIRAHLAFNTYGEAEGAIPVIRGFFYIVHVGNTGAAWSILSGGNVFLALLAAVTLVVIYLGRKALGLGGIYAQVCFGLLCGGIAGNLVDRLVRGHVVDFLDFHFGDYVYPTFNVADSAICVGVVLYILSSLKSTKRAS